MMRKSLPVLCLFVALATLVALVVYPPGQVSALPEYSVQLGEPCSTCHASPSGGGQRTPRGQAWVGEGKPGSVPDLMTALEILGVHLEVDQNDYLTLTGLVAPAQPLQLKPAQAEALYDRLKDYEGN
jgi:mono/diheme cytochrome c family protein